MHTGINVNATYGDYARFAGAVTALPVELGRDSAAKSEVRRI